MHTPGPWEAKPVHTKFRAPEAGDWTISAAHGTVTAIVWGGWTECEANARLIAASPELLEACRAIVAEYDDCDRRSRYSADPGEMDIGHDIVDAVRAAIAKATQEGEK